MPRPLQHFCIADAARVPAQHVTIRRHVAVFALALLAGAGTSEAAWAQAIADTTAPRRPQGALDSCTVTKIVDGDTFECREQGRIRPIGIDAPERNQGRHGKAATAAFTSLVPVGTVVQLEYDVERRDRYNRVLAYVWSEDVLVNWAMVRMGWAKAYPYGRTARYRIALREAEQRARAEGRGLWPLGGLECRKGDKRAKRC